MLVVQINQGKFVNITIRKLEANDLENYKTARLEAFKDSPEAFSESYEDEHLRPLNYFENSMGLETEHFTMGAFKPSRELVAFVTFKRDVRSKARHKAYIYTMYVNPELRRQKLGTKILDYVLNETNRMQGLEQIHLWVLNPEGSSARRLYLKSGWKPQGAFVKSDLKINGKYIDAEYMTFETNKVQEKLK